MTTVTSEVIVTAAMFGPFHIIIIAVPLVLSGGSGETHTLIAAIFDLPIFGLLGLFPRSRAALYGSSISIYIVIFGRGGTLMYACVGALLGWAIHTARRGIRAA